MSFESCQFPAINNSLRWIARGMSKNCKTEKSYPEVAKCLGQDGTTSHEPDSLSTERDNREPEVNGQNQNTQQGKHSLA